MLGLIPGTGKPVKVFGGASVLQTYLPIVITFMLVITGRAVPADDSGRLPRTGHPAPDVHHPGDPAGPARRAAGLLLGVQIATAAVIVLLATGVFNASIGQPVAFIVAFVLMAAAASTLGLLVAAVSFTSKAASTVGGVLFFVLLFFSGLWLPRAEMPGPLRGVSDALPVGAGVQAIQDAAAGRWASGLYFGVLAAWVIVCGVLAVRLFRWE